MSYPTEFMNSGLRIIPDDVCRRKKCQRLWLWHNKFTYLPHTFTRHKKLSELYLNNNSFNVFPLVLCQITNLQILDMSNNLLDSLPSSVEFLNLKRLVLSNNKFESFPEEVTKMLHLQELFLGWNRIKVLPCSVGKLEKLIVLKVNDNLICDIPDEIDKLVCLEFLNIERNKLERLPSTLFTKLDKLKSFECRDNPLADPPGYVCESGLQNIRNYLERHQVVAVGNSRLEMPRRNVHIEMPDTNTLADMDDYDCYPMTTKPRGIALIFNNKTFYRNPAIPSSVKLPDRAGTDTDAAKLSALWKKLDLMVLPHEDLNAADMLDVLWSTRLMDHRQFSCLIVCILSHGTLGKVCGCDGVTITLQELAKPFTPKYCKGLVGKPKMFFIQACQGEQSQQGIAQPSSTPQRDAIPFQYSSAPIQHSLQSSDESLPSIPNEADFLYGFCTVPGYEAYRDPDPSRGSWYISKLVESLEKYASTKHLLDILILVNKGVAEKGDENYKQMPAPQFTLRKKVLFN